MTVTVPQEPIWNLERRASSGFLVWRRDESKVKFRCEVEVLEYEKDPDEHKCMHDNANGKISSVLVVCVTCVAAAVVTFFLPWYLVGSS